MADTERSILLNPGPVTLSNRVRQALIRDDWCHREPEFAELTREINDHLVRVYRETACDFESVMLTGSGTSAVEAMMANFAPRDTATLVIVNGVYGKRIAEMLKVQGKPLHISEVNWDQPIDMQSVAAALDQHADISHIVAVHHETTTGRLNDLNPLGELCREREIPLLLDCVSSFGAEAIDVEGWNVVALAATAGKCLHGVPGIAFVLARKSLWATGLVAPGSVYLDLSAYYQGQHGTGYSPFTQSVQPAFALREALKELEEEGGWEQRRSIYRRRAGEIAMILQKLGLKTLLRPEDYSCVLWSWLLPEGYTYESVHDYLKQQGFVIYAGQGELGKQIFRIAHMGDISSDDLDRLMKALGNCFDGG
ncbi:MAG: 2-aminoethylphosphonate aminotransferase [Gammaproteobacteria bacterium]|jgi:2-aminoethylphosphonate-pyruvate transaminase|nr:2-aminoethylphosphonate aminotransferase [Chromatiales bacterium]MDP7093707.1 2-aminoethylphosphonate aminotransferase [Gammaproteobacteria bacterium]MDP7270075.1 2-aminoethylphosphonate aminotransferase [Gammaproteobacteria bacterium]MDP7661444.1 2-aminoethylphosphonate aminotransferase [Gammaproteobacteria bacterium]HJP04917.1 2-aminoethylphosphonate aminotransferase [Gammaproteobacteria bacterium]